MKRKAVLLTVALGSYALAQGFVLTQQGKQADAAVTTLATPAKARVVATMPHVTGQQP